ncbi:MAG: cupin domain-containing protein [Candidatus Izemoplasmatales bacterium]|nr:cupin domain-containing protein [Candidatus Izemoplasmatales bacterium]
MVVGNFNNLKAKNIDSPEAKNSKMKVLVSPENGWNDYVMRVVEVEQEGFTPKHSHPWPHINYIIEGKGILMIDGKDNHVEAGSYAYVPSDSLHQFKNDSESVFKFICIVPKEGHK